MKSPLGNAVAAARIRRAKKLIEEAQHSLERACAELCPLNGGRTAWSATSILASKAHTLFYRVDALLAKVGKGVELDHDPETSEFDRRDFPEIFQVAPVADASIGSGLPPRPDSSQTATVGDVSSNARAGTRDPAGAGKGVELAKADILPPALPSGETPMGWRNEVLAATMGIRK